MSSRDCTSSLRCIQASFVLLLVSGFHIMHYHVPANPNALSWCWGEHVREPKTIQKKVCERIYRRPRKCGTLDRSWRRLLITTYHARNWGFNGSWDSYFKPHPITSFKGHNFIFVIIKTILNITKRNMSFIVYLTTFSVTESIWLQIIG
jgi:hypothetical protein